MKKCEITDIWADAATQSDLRGKNLPKKKTKRILMTPIMAYEPPKRNKIDSLIPEEIGAFLPTSAASYNPDSNLRMEAVSHAVKKIKKTEKDERKLKRDIQYIAQDKGVDLEMDTLADLITGDFDSDNEEENQKTKEEQKQAEIQLRNEQKEIDKNRKQRKREKKQQKIKENTKNNFNNQLQEARRIFAGQKKQEENIKKRAALLKKMMKRGKITSLGMQFAKLKAAKRLLINNKVKKSVQKVIHKKIGKFVFIDKHAAKKAERPTKYGNRTMKAEPEEVLLESQIPNTLRQLTPSSNILVDYQKMLEGEGLTIPPKWNRTDKKPKIRHRSYKQIKRQSALTSFLKDRKVI